MTQVAAGAEALKAAGMLYELAKKLGISLAEDTRATHAPPISDNVLGVGRIFRAHRQNQLWHEFGFFWSLGRG